MRCAALFALLVTLIAGPLAASAAEDVTVGGYIFPPYVETDKDGEPSGLALELIDRLNAAQDRYRFAFFLTSATWRYGDFRNGRFDVIFFENPSSGWLSRDIRFAATQVFLRDREVYIALNKDGRGQAFFDNLAKKRIGAVQGYHYGFTNFRNDPTFLRERFKLTLVDTPARSINLVLAGRTQISVVTRSYLNRFMAQNPGHADTLLVADRPDKTYNHRALVRPDGPIGEAELETLLAELAARGDLADIWSAVGLADNSLL